MTELLEGSLVVGGVDTHKDLHVAAVVDNHDRVLGIEMLPHDPTWISIVAGLDEIFGDLQRIGIECSGSYGAGLLRYMKAADVACNILHRLPIVEAGKTNTSTVERPAPSALFWHCLEYIKCKKWNLAVLK